MLQSGGETVLTESIILILIIHFIFITYGLFSKRMETVYFNLIVVLFCLCWMFIAKTSSVFMLVILSMANALDVKIKVALYSRAGLQS